MRISLIAALAANHVIGHNNKMPWRLPADLQYFRATTMGKPVIMGRKTFESIGKPLHGRQNIIVTRNPAYQVEGAVVAHSVAEALAAAVGAEEVMVIGGAQIYEELLPEADRLYLTLVQAEFEGDTYFPTFDAQEWREVWREDHTPDEKNPYPYSFLILDRMGLGMRTF